MTEVTTTENKTPFFEDIERLRGFACILVLIQHIAWICPLRYVYNIVPIWLLEGTGGVHIFLAISGFVITLSLKDKLKMAQQPLFCDRFSACKDMLFSFYKRRAFRIFPVLLTVIALLGTFLACTEKDSSWVMAFLRLPIELFCGCYNDVMQFFGAEKPHICCSGPFWYLAVVIQFYVVWPIVLILCKNDNARMLTALCLGFLFLFIVQPVVTSYCGYRYYFIYNNLSELFFGSFLAFVYDRNAEHKSSKFSMLMAFLLVMAVWFYPNAMNEKYFSAHTVVSIASIATLICATFFAGSYNIPILNKVF
ncbi:MAG: acyltransferase, partial [Alphaproteobacteria bacterium]|nr:acyltransferase [Alphaproteobacteria bacterium]